MQIYKVSLSDYELRTSSLKYLLITSEDRRGFKFSDVLGWLSSIEKNPFKELKKKVSEELDIVSPEVQLNNEKYFSWSEIRKDIVDEIDRAEEFDFFMQYERKRGVFFRQGITASNFPEVDVRARLNFVVRDDYNEFSLAIGLPTTSYLSHPSEEIKHALHRIIHNLRRRGEIDATNLYFFMSHSMFTYGDLYYFSRYKAEINEKNVSEAVKMMLSIIDGTKEALEKFKEHYSR